MRIKAAIVCLLGAELLGGWALSTAQHVTTGGVIAYGALMLFINGVALGVSAVE